MNEEGHKQSQKTGMWERFCRKAGVMGSWEEKRGKGDSNKNTL